MEAEATYNLVLLLTISSRDRSGEAPIQLANQIAWKVVDSAGSVALIHATHKIIFVI